MSESDAMSLAQKGDSLAFEILFHLHHQNVLNRCHQMLKNRDEAEDLTQEVFLLLYRKINLFKHQSDFKTWLYRITTNKAICYLRRKSARLPSGAGDCPETFVRPNQLKRLEILEAIGSLSPEQKSCLEAEMNGLCRKPNSLRATAKQLKEVMA